MLKVNPTVFTMAVGDKGYILAEGSLKSTDRNRQLDVTATGAAGNTTALVGTAEQLAESLLAYHRAGASAFIIRGFDPLQDPIDWGKALFPMVRDGAGALSK